MVLKPSSNFSSSVRLLRQRLCGVVFVTLVAFVIFSLCCGAWYLTHYFHVKRNVIIGEPAPSRASCKACDPALPRSGTVNPLSPAGTFQKIIHQTYKDLASIPEDLRRASESCRSLNPDYKYEFWSDERIHAFLKKDYAWFYFTYTQYPYDIQRVDVFRYFLLYHYGGVYLDMDITCKVPLSKITANRNRSSLIVRETTPVGVGLDFLVGKKGSPVLFYVLSSLSRYQRSYLLPHATVMFSSGPMYLSNRLAEYASSEDYYVMPLDEFSRVYFSHQSLGSWHRWDTQLFGWLFAHLVHMAVCSILLALCCGARACYPDQGKSCRPT